MDRWKLITQDFHKFFWRQVFIMDILLTSRIKTQYLLPVYVHCISRTLYYWWERLGIFKSPCKELFEISPTKLTMLPRYWSLSWYAPCSSCRELYHLSTTWSWSQATCLVHSLAWLYCRISRLESGTLCVNVSLWPSLCQYCSSVCLQSSSSSYTPNGSPLSAQSVGTSTVCLIPRPCARSVNSGSRHHPTVILKALSIPFCKK